MTQVNTFPFRAVIFDMDGVLVDSEAFYWRELRDFAAASGLEVTKEELNAQVGMSHADFQRTLQRWWAHSGRELSPQQAEDTYNVFAAARPRDYRGLMNEGVPQTLAALRERGVRLALASSSPLANIRQVLAECGIDHAFEHITSGEQFERSKPDPQIYLHTLDLLGLPASACCCVEDSVPGIAAGIAAGLTVIAKREDRFGFSQDNAHTIIDTIPDLLCVGELLGER